MFKMTAFKETIITGKNQLIDYFKAGNKPENQWGIGTENEKFLFRTADFNRLDYYSNPGIKVILEYLQQNGWMPVQEYGQLIGLTADGASISLEPGGQFELSGKNFRTVHETYEETSRHFQDIKVLCRQFGVFCLPMGFDPLWKRSDIPWMPKQRYRIMRDYMPKKGTLGQDMMTRTATIQVNLDYCNEQDMVDKMRIAQAIQPIVTALFANSPFTEGKPNGYQSYRAHIWDDTDPDRCGFQDFIFDPDFSFERWVDYLLDVPMYFIVRDRNYIPLRGVTFRQFMSTKTNQPTMEDWETHVSTVFPDVRLKKYIEMRGADASCQKHIAALAAFWVGLLYNEESKQKTLDLIANWPVKAMKDIRSQVPVKGLKAYNTEINVREAAQQLIKLAAIGLTARAAKLNIDPENCYLEPLRLIIDSGQTQAERILDSYRTSYQSDLLKLIRDWQKRQIESCPCEC